jgi:hypothetical protein
MASSSIYMLLLKQDTSVPSSQLISRTINESLEIQAHKPTTKYLFWPHEMLNNTKVVMNTHVFHMV